jgi:HAMP domain-containing protein
VAERYERGIPVGEAAAELGISVDGVHKRIARGKLEAYKEAGQWRVIIPRPIERGGLVLTDADELATVDRGLDRLLETIQRQSEEIGRLKQRVRELQRRLDAHRMLEEDRRIPDA